MIKRLCACGYGFSFPPTSLHRPASTSTHLSPSAQSMGKWGMAARRPSSVCLICRTTRPIGGRRNLSTVHSRRSSYPAPAPTFFHDGDSSLVVANDSTRHPGRPGPSSHQTALGPSETEVSQLSRGSQPEKLSHHAKIASHDREAVRARHSEVHAGPIPLDTFRQRLRDSRHETKRVRHVLRAQLLSCERPREVLQAVSIAMQRDFTARHIADLPDSLIRAFYRCRDQVSDPEVLAALSGIISRFQHANLPVSAHLHHLGVKFAARTRSLPLMKKHLSLLRRYELPMTSNLFRSIIAKCSIGHRGLGEIRNGRWSREDLVQVLQGFDDCKHLPPEQQYHLGAFMDRSDWQYLHGYIAILSRCKQDRAVYHEWTLWKESEARRRPKNLQSMSELVTTRLRGDTWFIEQMAFSGNVERAWEILKYSGVDFAILSRRVKDKLLERVEFAGSYWNDHLRQELVDMYDRTLLKVERALGIVWVPAASGRDHGGAHVLTDDHEEVWDRLGAPDWTLETDHGYPYDSPTLVSNEARPLHDAAEVAQR